MKIWLITIGKTKAKGIQISLDHYAQVINRLGNFELVELKDQESDADREGQAFIAYLERRDWLDSGRHRLVLLDVLGTAMSSEDFAQFVQSTAERGAQDLIFLVGGAFGFSEKLRQRLVDAKLLSLSKLTLPHELARLVLAEQIYRALHIQSGSQYHHA